MLRLARLSIRRPALALLSWATIAVALSAIGLGVTERLSPSITTVAGTPSSRAQDLADSRLGPGVLVPILLEGPAQQLDRQGPALVRSLDRRGDARVVSAWDSGDAGKQLRPRPTAALVPSYFAWSVGAFASGLLGSFGLVRKPDVPRTPAPVAS